MTKKAADPTTTSPKSEKPFTIATLGLDLMDTTWRIAVPVILFAILGIIADRSLGSKPWLTLLSVVLGFIIAGLLLKRLLARIAKRDT